MRASKAALLGGLSLLPATSALAFPGPVPTQYAAQKLFQGYNPKPTTAPGVPHLFARQSASSARFSVGRNTCGWVDGDPDGAVYCSSTRTCMLYTPDGIIGMAGCCESGDVQNCGWNTGCVDREAFSTWSGPTNSFMMYCTATDAPFCVTWTYPADQIQDHGCAASDSDSTYQTIEKSLATAGTTTSVSLTYVPEGSVTGWRAEEQSTGTTSTRSNTRGPTNTGDQTGVTTGPSNIIPIDNGGDRGVSVGAIVGAVIGGLAALAIIVGAIIFFCWRRRKSQRQASAPAPVVTTAQESKPFMSQGPPGNHQNAYANQQSHYSQQYQQYPQQYYPPQPTQQQYPQSPPPAGYYKPSAEQDQSAYNPTASPPPQNIQPYYAPPPQPQQTSPIPQAALPVPAPYGQQSPVSPGTHSPVGAMPSPQQPPARPQGGAVHELG